MNRFIISLALLNLVSCTSSDANQTAEVEPLQTTPLVAVEQQLERTNCKEDETNCAKVNLKWLEYQDVAAAAVINVAILDKYRNELKAYSGRDTNSTVNDFEALALSFTMENSQFKNKFPKDNAEWFIDMSCREIFQNTDYLSIEFAFSAYTGGAHGSDNTYYLVFHPENGQTLQLEDIVSDIPYLRLVAESKFKQIKGLAPTASLSAQGYFVEDGNFPVEGNFALVNDTLLLHYNPYDVAAYAEGKTTLRIALSELKKAEI
jgi:hypothetical protein